MIRKITITTYPSMPGRYRVESAKEGARTVGRDARDAGEAAALALQYADGESTYVIVGEKNAVDQIPAELRAKGLK